MGNLRLTAPIYLLTSKETCYRCGKAASVVALSCSKFSDEEEGESEDSEPILVSNVLELPNGLLELIRRVHPHYEKRRSRMADSDYFMNICPHCNAHFGDFFLFSEPEGAFFPMDDAALAAITIRKLPIEGQVELDGSYHMGIGPEIFKKGTALDPV
ncbi:MAG: hypothetical protein ABII82_10455 [Verrucomicrobiota bacterium]